MNRFTKTTLLVLAIVAGTASGALAQKISVRLDPLSKDIYQLTYLNKGKCNVKVEVFDEKGLRLLSEQITRRKSFTKPYNFSKLEFGAYSFKVTDAEGAYVTIVKRSDELFMTANIKKIDEEKAKVIVRGEFMEPISVNIFDRNDVLLFHDNIDRERGFSKIYDLSRIKAEELRIEVVAAQEMLASSKF